MTSAIDLGAIAKASGCRYEDTIEAWPPYKKPRPVGYDNLGKHYADWSHYAERLGLFPTEYLVPRIVVPYDPALPPAMKNSDIAARNRPDLLMPLTQQDWGYFFYLGHGYSTLGPVDTLPALKQQSRFRSLHRLRMIGAGARAILGCLSKISVLDMACNWGAFSIDFALAGCREVIGVDLRQENVVKARALAAYLDCGASFETGNVFDLPENRRYDVVLNLGLLYHVTKQYELMKKTYELCDHIGVVETVTHKEPFPGFILGSGANIRQEHAAGEIHTELHPTYRGLIDMMFSVGFRDVVELDADPDPAWHNYNSDIFGRKLRRVLSASNEYRGIGSAVLADPAGCSSMRRATQANFPREEFKMTGGSALDTSAILAGTDKSSLQHDYVRHYERLFDEWRDGAITVVEIGIQTGASLRLWQSFFSQATIVGIDVNENCRQHAGGRTVVEIGSQNDPAFLAEISRNYSPMIVIDDGSHMAQDILFTFHRLFPVLQPGGYYVVEDLFLHLGPVAAAYIGAAARPPADDILEWGRLLLGAGRLHLPENGRISYDLFRQIDSIQIISGAAVLRKKPVITPLAAIAAAEAVVEKSANPVNWDYLADFIIKKNGPLDRAEAAVRRAIAMAADRPSFHERLSAILERQGDWAGAIEALQCGEALYSLSRTGQAPPRFKRGLDRLRAKAKPEQSQSKKKTPEPPQPVSVAQERQPEARDRANPDGRRRSDRSVSYDRGGSVVRA